MKLLLFSPALVLMLVYHASAASLPDTGQTKCYDTTQEIACPDPGEDFYGQDAHYGTNVQSYTKLDANGTDLPDAAAEWVMVRDNISGLIWQEATSPIKYNNEHAASYCSGLRLGGYRDWRLPTVQELGHIVDRSTPQASPTINTGYFLNTESSSYWSSTPYASIPESGWLVSFYSGALSYGKQSCSGGYARAVRHSLCRSGGRFIDNADGTVTDTGTGLIWQQDIPTGTYTWKQALAYCENLQLAASTDWRLPNINELHSLVAYHRYDASIDMSAFPGTTSSPYWSSTTDARSPESAWYVSFKDGYLDTISKFGTYHVRAVRSGQCEVSSDPDCDGLLSLQDNCPYCHNQEQHNADGDALGDACDNCPDVTNAGQEDADLDTIGDACDSCPNDPANDSDGDTICGNTDNCPTMPNQDQRDDFPPQGNRIGDACDCEGNFDCDADTDSTDAAAFKADYGRSSMREPCSNAHPCNGDFKCDQDVDTADAALFKSDYGKSSMTTPCATCAGGAWCSYQ